MTDLPLLDADDFRELHLLPRVLFSVGGLILVGGFYVRILPIGLAGLAMIFAGVGLNIAVDVLISAAKKLWWWGVLQALFCLLLVVLLALAAWSQAIALGVAFYTPLVSVR